MPGPSSAHCSSPILPAPSPPDLTAIIVVSLMRGMLGAQEAAAVVSWTVAILVSYGGVGLTATVQAVIFRRLVGWREGAGLPALFES